MRPTSTPRPTPALAAHLPEVAAPPRRSRSSRWLGMLVAALLPVAVTLHSVHAVGRLRRLGRHVRPLDHRLTLPGSAPTRRLVVLGDSAAAGHGLAHADEALARRVGRALHARDGRATEVTCVAADGATTATVLATQTAAAADAEVVVLGVGVNDAVRPRRAVREVADHLDVLLTEVRAAARPGAQVVLVGCPDLSRAPGLPRALRPPVGWRCRAVAAAQAEVAARHAVPVVAANRTVVTHEVFGADGFHPGAVGHARLAARVVALLVPEG